MTLTLNLIRYYSTFAWPNIPPLYDARSSLHALCLARPDVSKTQATRERPLLPVTRRAAIRERRLSSHAPNPQLEIRQKVFNLHFLWVPWGVACGGKGRSPR